MSLKETALCPESARTGEEEKTRSLPILLFLRYLRRRLFSSPAPEKKCSGNARLRGEEPKQE